MRTLRILSSVITLVLAFTCPNSLMASIYGPAPYHENLLTNPNGDTGDLIGWTITANGGNGWWVDVGGYPTTEDNGFKTSYSWDTREQIIDLLAHGFTAEYLDTQPTIHVSEIFERVFCADQFFLSIDLLDINRNVIYSWSSGIQQHSDTTCDYSGYKEKISTKLDHYGVGARFIRWRDGGKDSEYWLGHFGPKLQNAYLALAPANLLLNPGDLDSWDVSIDHDFEVTGPPEKRQFRTSYWWSQRQQTIDLLALGFTEGELDSGELPIVAEGTYREVACPDEYYLRVELLGQNQDVLESRDSGAKVHEGECDWTYSEYGETIHHRFDNYPPGVRYIRWEDGGKDREYWAGHFGAILEAPYLGIVNTPAWEEREGGIEEAWDYRLLSEADESATYRTLSKHRILSQVSAQGTDSQATLCNADCKIEQIRSDLAQNNSDVSGAFWELTSNNSDVQIFSSPYYDSCHFEWWVGHVVCYLQTANQHLRDALKGMVQNGTYQIDITTLFDIEDQWIASIRSALQAVERNSALHGYFPIVRIHIGFPSPMVNWDYHLRRLLNELTAGLYGNSNMAIYISGNNRTVDVLNWNHSKIIAVDGKEAIVGGHNLYNEYLTDRPIFDTSVKIRGDSAWTAHSFVNSLISDHMRQNLSGGGVRHAFVWRHGNVTVPAEIPSSTRIGPPSSGAVKILGVGQLSVDSTRNSPLKTAVQSLLRTAEKSIFISQQSLTHYSYPVGQPGVDPAVAAILAKKAVENNVRVAIILSNTNVGGYSATANNYVTLREIWQASGLRDDADNRAKFCENVSVSNLRFDDILDYFPDTTESPKNHSKTIMVDKQVFLVGSHNLYPQTPAQHDEFSLIVADGSKAEEFNRLYWQPVLSCSARASATQKECLTAIEPLPWYAYIPRFIRRF